MPTLPSREQDNVQLRWSTTIARSGRFKDVPMVFEQHQCPPRQPSRKGYNVRFRVQKDETGHVSRRSQQRKSFTSMMPHVAGGAGSSPNTTARNTQAGSIRQDGNPETTVAESITVPPSDVGVSNIMSQEPIIWPDLLSDSTGGFQLEQNPALSDLPLLDAALSPNSLDQIPVLVYSFTCPDACVPADYVQNLIRDHEDALWVSDSSELMHNFTHDFGLNTTAAPDPPPPSKFGRVSVTDDIPPHIDTGMTTDHIRYLQIFIEKVAPRFLPLCTGTDNPILSLIIPASFASGTLCHAICAISANQTSISGTGTEDDVHKGQRHGQIVRRMVQDSFSQTYLPKFTDIAACMLIQSFEILDINQTDWIQWIKYCTFVVRRRDQMEQDIRNGGEWLIFTKCVVAMETMAAASSNVQFGLASKYWKTLLHLTGKSNEFATAPQKSTYLKALEDDFFEKILGCPAVVLMVLTEMTDYVTMRERDALGPLDTERLEDFNRWEDLLHRWCPAHMEGSNVQLMEAFRHAALVYFTRRIRKLPYDHAVVQRHCQRTLFHINRLDDLHDYSIVSTWPTMIAGLELDDQERPDLALGLLRSLGSAKQAVREESIFAGYKNLLMMVWRQRRENLLSERVVNIEWQDICKEQGRMWCFW